MPCVFHKGGKHACSQSNLHQRTCHGRWFLKKKKSGDIPVFTRSSCLLPSPCFRNITEHVNTPEMDRISLIVIFIYFFPSLRILKWCCAVSISAVIYWGRWGNMSLAQLWMQETQLLPWTEVREACSLHLGKTEKKTACSFSLICKGF